MTRRKKGNKKDKEENKSDDSSPTLTSYSKSASPVKEIPIASKVPRIPLVSPKIKSLADMLKKDNAGGNPSNELTPKDEKKIEDLLTESQLKSIYEDVDSRQDTVLFGKPTPADQVPENFHANSEANTQGQRHVYTTKPLYKEASSKTAEEIREKMKAENYDFRKSYRQSAFIKTRGGFGSGSSYDSEEETLAQYQLRVSKSKSIESMEAEDQVVVEASEEMHEEENDMKDEIMPQEAPTLNSPPNIGKKSTSEDEFDRLFEDAEKAEAKKRRDLERSFPGVAAYKGKYRPKKEMSSSDTD